MTENTELISFGQAAAAHLLKDYLNSQQISAEYRLVEKSTHPHQVYLLDVTQLSKAQQITRDFLQNPSAPKYQQAAWENGQQVELAESSSLTAGFKPITFAKQPFTIVVLIICVAVYLLKLFGGSGWVQDWLMILPVEVVAQNHQWWRMFTPAFVHFSELHIVFNLLWWWILAAQIERKLGLSSILLIFAISALVSNLAQLFVSGINFGGLSGVVYALVGFVWLVGNLQPQLKLSLPNYLVGFMLIWLLLGYAQVLPVNMANTAHLAGLLSGLVLAWLFCRVLFNRAKH